jgi:hypothetical protein
LLFDASKFFWLGKYRRLRKAYRLHKQSPPESGAHLHYHYWQHWVVGTIRLFVHPEVRAYDKGEESEALAWITG